MCRVRVKHRDKWISGNRLRSQLRQKVGEQSRRSRGSTDFRRGAGRHRKSSSVFERGLRQPTFWRTWLRRYRWSATAWQARQDCVIWWPVRPVGRESARYRQTVFEWWTAGLSIEDGFSANVPHTNPAPNITAAA